MADDFVDICVVCKKGVPKDMLVYQKGKVFHSTCFTQHGSTFPAPDKDLDSLSARTRVELVLLKNLKARSEMERQQSRAKAKKKSKVAKKRAKPRKVIRKKTRAKKSRPKTKPRKTVKKTRAKPRTSRKGRAKGAPKRRSRR